MTTNNKHLSIPNNGYFFHKNNFKIVNYFSIIQHKILNINIIEIKKSLDSSNLQFVPTNRRKK